MNEKLTLAMLRKTKTVDLVEMFSRAGGSVVEIDGHEYRVMAVTPESEQKMFAGALGSNISSHIYGLMDSVFRERSETLVKTVTDAMSEELDIRSKEMFATIDRVREDVTSVIELVQNEMLVVIRRVGAELDDDRIEQIRTIEARLKSDLSAVTSILRTTQIPSQLAVPAVVVAEGIENLFVTDDTDEDPEPAGNVFADDPDDTVREFNFAQSAPEPEHVDTAVAENRDVPAEDAPSEDVFAETPAVIDAPAPVAEPVTEIVAVEAVAEAVVTDDAPVAEDAVTTEAATEEDPFEGADPFADAPGQTEEAPQAEPAAEEVDIFAEEEVVQVQPAGAPADARPEPLILTPEMRVDDGAEGFSFGFEIPQRETPAAKADEEKDDDAGFSFSMP